MIVVGKSHRLKRIIRMGRLGDIRMGTANTPQAVKASCQSCWAPLGSLFTVRARMFAFWNCSLKPNQAYIGSAEFPGNFYSVSGFICIFKTNQDRLCFHKGLMQRKKLDWNKFWHTRPTSSQSLALKSQCARSETGYDDTGKYRQVSWLITQRGKTAGCCDLVSEYQRNSVMERDSLK